MYKYCHLLYESSYYSVDFYDSQWLYILAYLTAKNILLTFNFIRNGNLSRTDSVFIILMFRFFVVNLLCGCLLMALKRKLSLSLSVALSHLFSVLVIIGRVIFTSRFSHDHRRVTKTERYRSNEHSNKLRKSKDCRTLF